MDFMTQDVREIVRAYMAGLDTPRSLAVKLLVEHNEWGQLTALAVDPSRYSNADGFWRDYAATELFRKCASFSDPSTLKAATFNKWLASEQKCCKTNLRLSMYDLPAACLSSQEASVASFLASVRKIIRLWIGDRPPNYSSGRFGPGATVSDPSGLTSIPDKINSTPTFTPNAWLELVSWSGTAWASASAALGRVPVRVRGNKYFTVPKSATSLRSCAKEPSINGFYQLGAGSFLKGRLQKIGLDLYEGQSLHRRMAQKASIDGTHSTIDLSSASDTLATGLVKLVLPPSWFEYLDSLRSHFTEVEGRVYRLEKFASMGNGFTFELETLIFAALCLALRPDMVVGVDFSVYGDDIIVPTDLTRDVIAALKFVGFDTNIRKTFTEGPFRESCGGDYFSGVAIPVTRIEELPSEPQHFIGLANSLRRTCKVAEDLHCVSRLNRVRKTWFRVLDCLPKGVRELRGPEGLGDLVIHDHEDRWKTRTRNSIRYIRAYRPLMTHVIRWEGFPYDVQMASALYRVPTNLPTKVGQPYPRHIMVGSRSSLVSYKVGWTPYS